ncbi:hypothetical protein [Primorskyibacter marinus]|uniref:hypothetical protein n=1 Tax=Primorskyibacter marinus TaxID=1977320 RepID=UPI000E300AEE|nr:hypothetical protein [Primorskyibacter marinus]
MTLAIVFHIEGAAYVVSDCLVSRGTDILDSPHTAFTSENIKARHTAILLRKQLFLDDSTVLLAAGNMSDILGFFVSMRDYWNLLNEHEKHPEKIRSHFENFFYGRRPIEMMALKMMDGVWNFQGFNFKTRNISGLADVHAIGSGAIDAFEDLDNFCKRNSERLCGTNMHDKIHAVRDFIAIKNLKRYFTPESAMDKTWGGVLEESIFYEEPRGWNRFGNKIFVTIDVQVIQGKISCAPGLIFHLYRSDDENPCLCTVNYGTSSVAGQWPIIVLGGTPKSLDFVEFQPEIVNAHFTFTSENGNRRTGWSKRFTAEDLKENGEGFIFSGDPILLPFNGPTFHQMALECLRLIAESPEIFDRLDQAEQFRALL